MALISFKNFYFKYNEKDRNVLSNINLEVLPGEFVLFCGPSGSGKTTLLTNLKKEIRPAGVYEGKIHYDDEDIEMLEDKKSACEIGFLFQNPEDQFVSDNVLQEIAFPLENIGLPTEDIRNRIAEMAAFFGLEKYLYKNIKELSGGQKQLVNLCSLLVLKPKLLLLDEPTSQLDPIAAYNFLSMLRRLNEEFSITIMATEHRIDNIFPFADKTVFLEDGHIKYINKPRTICSKAYQNPVFRNYLPSVTRVHFLLQSKYSFLNKCKIPLNIREGMQELNFLDEKLKESGTALWRDINVNLFKNSENLDSSDILLKCKDIWFGYINDHIILRGVFLDIKKGEFISIFGGNGTGKTTLLQILSGIIKPQKGKIKLKKGIKVGYVHQNPMVHFWRDTVQEELSLNFLEKLEDNNSSKFRRLQKYMPQNSHENINSNNNQIILDSEKEKLIEFFGISHLLDKHPYDCSGGEKQKIAIVKSLLTKPDILFLDEPTKGLDPVSKLHLAYKLKKMQENGLTIVMATHDIEFAAEYSKRCMILFDGKIQIDNTPKAVFSSNNFYTTFVNRMVKNFLPESITLNDVKEKWIG
ncbi:MULTISPECIES: ABC transporter ATP-binding protein [Methanobacterium]|jgi:energy-coupling factor transport system ATP-binding protein|uniref:ATP-binding cassette domain-containing protein n=1 Tax=Methanobacterium veterum TaxID=408577 RepID=A0A9E5DPA3_9EURY|nr:MULTISPECIES: ATP-binding cassette domain-containing protein [Methanobacterium]MCZ3367126.1 ATP-binding cassette domain-containing protein [Methanobacterium veterum]MCZ3373726.1 ATP-binding cassette domain-containing protein [Methanobacterium veterum]